MIIYEQDTLLYFTQPRRQQKATWAIQNKKQKTADCIYHSNDDDGFDDDDDDEGNGHSGR